MPVQYKLCFDDFSLFQSEIGFGKIESYTKLDKLGEVRIIYVERADQCSKISCSIHVHDLFCPKDL